MWPSLSRCGRIFVMEQWSLHVQDGVVGLCACMCASLCVHAPVRVPMCVLEDIYLPDVWVKEKGDMTLKGHNNWTLAPL